MAVAYQSSAIGSIANLSGSGTVAKPTGTVSGDLLVGQLFATNVPASVSMSGFTILATSSANVWFVWKIAGGSEPASYTFGRTGANAGVMGCVLARYAGTYDTSTPVSVYDGAFNNSGIGTVTVPSVTAPSAGSKAVTFYAQTGNTSRTFTQPGGFTFQSGTIRTDPRYSYGVADKDVGAGATGTMGWSSTLNGTNQAVGLVINPPAVSTITGDGAATAAAAVADGTGWVIEDEPAAMAGVRAALANRDTDRVDIGLWGASVVEGYPAPPALWVETQLAQKLRERYPTAGIGSGGGYGYIGIPTLGLEGTATTPIDMTGGAFNENLGWGGHHRVWFITAAQTTIVQSFTVPADATRIVIETVGGAGGSAGAGRYRINGGAWVSFNQNAPSSQTIEVVIDQAFVAGDVIEVGHAVGPTGNVVVSGWRHYDGDETKGIQVHNHGHYGYRIQDWNVARSAVDPGFFAPFLNYDLIIMSDWGGNDGGGPGNLSAADFETAFAELIDWTRAQGYAGDFLIVSLYNIEAARTFVDPWSDYVDAMRDVAAAKGAAFLQLDQYMPASPNALLDADGVHGNADGSAYDVMSTLMLHKIAGELPVAGEGSATAPAATSDGTGTLAITGTGASTAPAGTADGTGNLGVTGTGAAESPAAAADGTGTLVVAGPGEATAAAGTSEGTATLVVTGSGEVTAPPGSSAGAGNLALTGTGISTVAAATATGAGQVGNTVAGGGTSVAPAATSDGSGVLAITGTGTSQTAPAATAGTGDLRVAGTAELVAASAESSGQALLVITGAGASVAPAGTTSGAGRDPGPVREVTVTAVQERTRSVEITERARAGTILERTRTVTITERE